MKKKTSWSNFECIHSDVTDTFEQLCRILFKRQFLDNTCVLTSSPNHPGIEVSPIYSPKVNRTISFQAKYFLSRVDYSQIQKSVNKTIKKYAGQLDVFYLYCNKDLTLTSQSYKRIESTLKSVDIELRVISNNEILTQVAQYTDLQSFFFENHIITRDWFVTYNQLSFDSLGMRYNSEFNVETRTDEMIQLFIRNQKAIDKINSKKIELIKELDTLYSLRESEIISKIKKFIDSLEDVTVDDIENYLKWNDKINRSLESELKELSINKEKLENKIESTRDMSSENRNRIFNQVRDIDRLIGYLHWIGSSNKEEELISNKILVVTGEAGMGKTQLLANSVKETMSEDGYALLLLGHHYLSSSDISKQIMEKFEFDYAFREFLDMLDILGEIENQHIYIFIDAINETPNRSVWKNGLSTIISEICRRKHIKLILSVRTGYEKLIFEENMIERLKSGELLRITHHGFQDDSVAAIKEFLNCHNIPFSPSELLNYEMTNPLFLTLFCKTYNGEELNLFQMFERFITLIDEEIQKALGIPDSGKILKKLLLEIAEYQLSNSNNYLIEEDLFQMKFWSYYSISNKPYFLSFLLKSGLMIGNVRQDKEVYSFGYNLLEDYLKAQKIMEFSFDKEELESYLEKELLKIENGEIQNNKNIDTFLFVSCFYFEEYDEDCIKLIERISNEYDCYDLANRYLKSFSWRPIDTVSRELFRNIANSYPTNYQDVFNVLIENAIKKKQPYKFRVLT